MHRRVFVQAAVCWDPDGGLSPLRLWGGSQVALAHGCLYLALSFWVLREWVDFFQDPKIKVKSCEVLPTWLPRIAHSGVSAGCISS